MSSSLVRALGARRGLGAGTLAIAALVAGLIVTVAAVVTSYAAQRDAIAQRARIELVWPDVLALPANERVFIEAMAEHCHLARRPLTAYAATVCLTEAAADPAFSPKCPKLRSGTSPARELARLLHERRQSVDTLAESHARAY